MDFEYQTDCDVELRRRCFQARAEYLRSLKLYTETTKQFFRETKVDAKKLSRISVNYNILRE